MNKRSEIIVEEFAQGITVRWRDMDGATDPSKSLAINGTECVVIGKEIWKDIYEILHDNMTEKVRIRLEYDII